MPLVVSLLVGALVVVGAGLALIAAPRGAAQEQGALLEYPVYPPTPTVGAPPTPGPALASATVLTASTFDDACALDSWRFVDQTAVLAEMTAQWAVADGRLVQDYAGRARNPSIQEAAGLTGAADWTDYTVQVQFYDEFNGTAGLLARYTGQEPTAARYYRVRVLKESFPATPKLVLEKVVDGVATALVAIKGPGFSERAWHTLALSVQGGSLTVTLDGQVVAEAQDAAPLPAGQAGLYTRAIGGILFDNFLVTAP
jgi:hypothetical protein